MIDETHRALEPIARARQMLDSATTFDDFRDLRDMAEAARAFAKARGLGLDAENAAAEYIIRAERGMGASLLALRKAGKLASTGQYAGGDHPRAHKDGPPSTAQYLGVPQADPLIRQVSNFQRLAEQWSDAEFERRMQMIRESGARLSKVDFYRGPRAVEKREAKAVNVMREALASTEPTDLYQRFRYVSTEVIEHMSQFPNDELGGIATAIRELASAYNATKAERES